MAMSRLLLIFAAFFVGVVTAQKAKSPWLTLNGDAPKVVARGGFSGLFPDSSSMAYEITSTVSLPDAISLCDVQLTKDGAGICLPTMLLNNSTNIQSIIPDGQNTYNVDGVNTTGWFSVDFDLSTLAPVAVIRSELSRSNEFDGNLLQILLVEDVKSIIKTAPLWLNIQHDIFYRQHNLSMRSYLISVSKRVVVDYVSSPEVNFLRSLGTRLGSKTKTIFRFLGQDITEPSTNQAYGSLLKNLTFIKTFASGIVVPKNYIWPVTPDNYLLPHTSVVTDAHKAGLEIFAADFANDVVFSYNYSYDPISEYLNFIDNGDFAVDGVVTDFPITPSEAIGCFSHLNKNSSDQGKPLVITHNGASGIYPDCTDLAYKQAVDDGADIIDCPVQITKDGTLVCMSSINLMDTTNVVTSPFSTKTTIIPELQPTPGIFTFNLSWDDIQKNLKPKIATPFPEYRLDRNPKYKNAGSFMKLSDFLTYAKAKANPVSGILITIENAAYLAENLGASITDGVIKALKEAGFSNQKTQDVMIQSTNSSVLNKFKQQTNYKLVYNVDETISNAGPSSLSDIKKFATHIAVEKKSIFPTSKAFITTQTDLVSTLHKAGFTVFVYVLRNEFISQPWDFFADPTVEINTYFQGVGVDGIVTDFPGTATRYRKNSCLNLKDDAPLYMSPVQVGGLLSAVPPTAVPALSPYPVLDPADVVEPPLPSGIIKPVNVTPPAAQPSDSVLSASSSLILVVGAVYGSVFVLLF